MSKRDESKPTKPAHFPVATVIEVSIIGVAPASAYPELQTMTRAFQAELTKRFEDLGGKAPHPRWAEVRPATREELLTFIPRKRHYSADLRDWLCDTAHVAQRNLTSNKDEVTCRLCRRALGLIDEIAP